MLEQVEKINYIGLVVDSKLTWDDHIDHVVSKAKQWIIQVEPICRNMVGCHPNILDRLVH